jgi:predicted HTH domain antitoxin
MPLTISDEVLKEAGLTEAQARLEFAIRLFDAERLNVHQAAKLAGMERYPFEAELRARNIAIYRIKEEDLKQELEAIQKLRV